jgi:hypothetical protein
MEPPAAWADRIAGILAQAENDTDVAEAAIRYAAETLYALGADLLSAELDPILARAELVQAELGELRARFLRAAHGPGRPPAGPPPPGFVEGEGGSWLLDDGPRRTSREW